MKQEYLFVDDKYKSEIEQYTHKIVAKEILNIDGSDCWIATFFLKGENENTANILSEVNEYIIEHFSPTVLSSGCSAYYNKALYPLFNEFERKLRKLLYLKTALSKSEKDIETIKNVEKKDLGEIFEILFADKQFVTNVRKVINEKTWQFTKNEVLTTLQNIPEQTFWDDTIGADIVPLLKSDFMRVKSFRNDVMHAHNINSSAFRSARKLLKDVNEQLDMAIQNTIITKSGQKDFTTALNDAIKDIGISNALSNISSIFDLNGSLLTSKLSEGVQQYTRLASSPEYQQVIGNLPQIIQTYKNIAEFMSLTSDEWKNIQQNIELYNSLYKNSFPKSEMDSRLTKPSEQDCKSEEGKTNGQDENGNVEHDGSEHK